MLTSIGAKKTNIKTLKYMIMFNKLKINDL